MFKKRLVAIFTAVALNSAVVHASGIPTVDIAAGLNAAIQIQNQATSLVNEATSLANQAKQIKNLTGARDFVGRINKDLEEVPEEWGAMMGNVSKSNAETELKKASSGITADSSQKTYLAYAQAYMADANKSVKNWEQLSKLQAAANEAEDIKASQDIANRIQMQLQTDRLTEKRLAAMKETADMQKRIYSMNESKRQLCYAKSRVEADIKKCNMMP
jgi:hypothetical protein